MIQVKLLKSNNNIISLTISGHADSAPYGQDLVCAGVSCVGIGLINSLDELVEGSCDLTYQDNLIKIKVIKDSNRVQDILKVGLIQLKTIQQQYSKYLEIQGG
ncbi:MAG: ribosomal-processing cysteine protease Prp [Erysipelotrichaceae bacterium]